MAGVRTHMPGTTTNPVLHAQQAAKRPALVAVMGAGGCGHPRTRQADRQTLVTVKNAGGRGPPQTRVLTAQPRRVAGFLSSRRQTRSPNSGDAPGSGAGSAARIASTSWGRHGQTAVNALVPGTAGCRRRRQTMGDARSARQTVTERKQSASSWFRCCPMRHTAAANAGRAIDRRVRSHAGQRPTSAQHPGLGCWAARATQARLRGSI
jgi:hypothetical protein